MAEHSVTEPKVGEVYYDRISHQFRRLVEMRCGRVFFGEDLKVGYLFSPPTASYEEARVGRREPNFYIGYGLSPEKVAQRFVLVTPENLPEFAEQVVRTEVDWCACTQADQYVHKDPPTP